LLYQETINENKIIIFTANNALATAYMYKEKGDWTYKRNSNFFAFQAMGKPMYSAEEVQLKTLNGEKYYLVMGRIYYSNITNLTLSNDSIKAIIKKNGDNIFWFKILYTQSNLIDIKTYNKDGNLIKD
jgi:hypothetical protein